MLKLFYLNRKIKNTGHGNATQEISGEERREEKRREEKRREEKRREGK